MIEAPKQKHAWHKTVGIYAASAIVVAGLASIAGEVAARCQCHYTPALFAEREGLRRIVFDVKIPEERRDDFVERMEQENVFVDPTYSNGTSSVAAVFARVHQAEKLRSIARRFR